MPRPFYFKVRFNTNYEGEEAPSRHMSGLGIANGFIDAATQIVNNFRDDLISIEHLELSDDNDLIYLPDKVCQKYMNDYTYGDGEPIK